MAQWSRTAGHQGDQRVCQGDGHSISLHLTLSRGHRSLSSALFALWSREHLHSKVGGSPEKPRLSPLSFHTTGLQLHQRPVIVLTTPEVINPDRLVESGI